jgi:hypothetical protein
MYNVNLVFHGVFAVVLKEETIDVLFPYFSPHQYLLGCWDLLEPMPKGDMELVGVEGINDCHPNPDFSTDSSPAVSNLPARCDTNLFCSLKLNSYPSAVYPFRAYTMPLSAQGQAILPRFPFGGLQGRYINVSSLAGPIVFRYRTDDPDAIQLVYRGKPLKFEKLVDDPSSTINLHFFAEGEKDLPQPDDPDRLPQVSIHYAGAWSSLTSLIAGMDVQLDQLYPFIFGKTTPPPKDTGLPGLSPFELQDLDEIYEAKMNPGGPVFGGDTDCDKAHLLVDNRP